jgi:ribose transport system substrate-binding protein
VINRKLIVILLLLVIAVPVLGANAAPMQQDNSFTIGISNSFVGSEWRTQMIQNMEDVVAEFAAMGIEIELVIESADTDVQGQIQQVQNLMNRGVDAIIINPGDQTGLNLVLEEAAEEGIVIIAIDQEIGAAGAYNVVIDQTEWARISMRWLAEELDGEGDIVLIEGFVGHPANEARMQGVTEVLAEYPGINVVGRETGMWDQATGQQVMSDFLASLPNIDGVWTQDGMAQGALTAVNTANPDEWPVMVGEARAGYLQLWNEIQMERPEFTAFGVVNPPGVGADGIRVAVELLMGGEVDESQLSGPFGNTLYVPIPYWVDAGNFEAEYNKIAEMPESYTLDGMIRQGQARMFMNRMNGLRNRDMGSFTIGVSNSFVGSEWRTQMIQNMEDVVSEFAEYGIEIELVIESADTDVQGQIQQVQNLMNRGVDAILINPGDQTGLNLVLEEAAEEGIVVIAIDQEIGAAGTYNVVIDQTEWARISMRWLAEQLGGEGDIVLIEGFVGHPANEARMAGVEEVLAMYPGINVVGRESGMWDQATGQQVMSDFLASLPNIDGVWTQDGMAQGALTAVNTANPDEWPVMVGEARAGYLQLWSEIKMERPEFTAFGVVNPPGVGSDGIRVIVEILTGGMVDDSQLSGPFGNTLYVPIPYSVDAGNFEAEYNKIAEMPESYTLDGMISQAQAYAFMK